MKKKNKIDYLATLGRVADSIQVKISKNQNAIETAKGFKNRGDKLITDDYDYEEFEDVINGYKEALVDENSTLHELWFQIKELQRREENVNYHKKYYQKEIDKLFMLERELEKDE